MASRRSKQQRGGRGGGDAGPEISKEEYAVANFMRNNVPTKTTTLCGMRVEYFVGSKAVDALLASQVIAMRFSFFKEPELIASWRSILGIFQFTLL